MTSDEILVDMFDLFGRSQDDTRFVSTFYREITKAQRALCSKRAGRWGFLLEIDATATTTASTRSVALASDFGQLFAKDCVRDTTNDSWLEKISYAQWRDRWYDDGSSTDNPDKFWIVNATMYFTPLPGGAYTIEYAYFKSPAKVTARATTLAIPEDGPYAELLTLMVQRRLMKPGAWSVPDMVVEDKDIAELRKDAVQHDTMRYAELRNGLPRGTRTVRHG